MKEARYKSLFVWFHLYIYGLEKSNLQGKKADHLLGEKGAKMDCNEHKGTLCSNEQVLTLDCGDGCTCAWIDLTSSYWTLKMVELCGM